MRRPVQYVLPHDAAQAVARIMRDANVGLVPVCDGERHVLGVITDRDLAIRLVADAHDAATSEARTVMSTDVVTCRDTDDLERAEALMRRHQKSRIVVLDADDGLRGVISLSDIASVSGLAAATILRSVAVRELLGESGLRR